jgi:hypothetical protein
MNSDMHERSLNVEKELRENKNKPKENNLNDEGNELK